MAATRPYFCTFRGEDHIIEASSAAVAVQHIVGADVTVLRAARPGEVSAWARAGKEIPVASDKVLVTTPPATAAVAEATMPEITPFNADNVAQWLTTQLGNYPAAQVAWTTIRSEGRMTLDSFDRLRKAAPIINEIFADPTNPIVSVDPARAMIEQEPMPLQQVLDTLDLWIRDPNHSETAKSDSDPDDAGEEPRDNGGVLANGQE